MRHPRRAWGAALYFATVVCIWPQTPPVLTIPVGDSPFSLSLSTRREEAAVVNLFPDGSDGSNVRVVDLNSGATLRRLRAGTRLVAIAVTGDTALVVNEDQDVIRFVDLQRGSEVAQAPTGSRPSNVALIGDATAMVVNGTSGDITLVDIASRTVSGPPVTVGADPRAATVHPAQNRRYAYVVLGGDRAIAVLDLQQRPYRVVGRAPTGADPVDIAITSDGQRAIVANLSNNTVTVYDTSNPASPARIGDVPVGVKPTSLAVDPRRPSLVFVANLSSPFLSLVDVSKPLASAFTGIVPTGAGMSAVRVDAAGSRLYALEFTNRANLRVYSMANLALASPPVIDIPGEPRLVTFLEAGAGCADSFYIAEARLAPGQKEGRWGMEVLVSGNALAGGFNLGGGIERDGLLPSFGAFSLGSPQRVTVTVNAQALEPGAMEIEAAITTNGAAVATQRGQAPLRLAADLPAGFHVVTVKTLPGASRGTFQMSAEAVAFSGGVVAGGFIAPNLAGFGGFCLPGSQNVDVRLIGRSEYGESASGDLVLNLRDGRQNLLRTVNNSIPSSSSASAPPAPSLSGVSPRLYVDAAAPAGGNGSQARPFRAITQALNVCRRGDTILVLPGRYSPSTTGEVIPIGRGPSGSNGLQPGVQLLGSGAAVTIIDAENALAPDGAGNAVVIAQDNVRFAGFTVRRAAQAGLYVTRARGVVVENNVFSANTRFGLGGAEARGIVVRNNVAESNLETGIAFSSSSPEAGVTPPEPCNTGGPFGAFVIRNVSVNNRADGFLFSAGGAVCAAENRADNNGSSGIEFNNRTEGSPHPPLGGVILRNVLNSNGGLQFAFAGTGILVTESADVSLIADNVLTGNRPFGIGIFLSARAGVIRDNRVVNSPQQAILVQRSSNAREISSNDLRDNGQSAIFVENQSRAEAVLANTATGNGVGLSVLDRSSVGRVENNTFSRNEIGMQLSVSGTAETVGNNTLDSNRGGVFVDKESALRAFENNRLRNNRDLAAINIGGSTASIGANQIGGTLGTGIAISGRARVTVTGAAIENNSGGLGVHDGAAVTASGLRIAGNSRYGVEASGAGATLTLGPGTSITGTRAAPDGSGGYGIVSTAGGAVTCSAPVTLSGNTGGNTFGPAPGCVVP